MSHIITHDTLTNEVVQVALREIKSEGKSEWAEVAKAVHDIDEERIQHCKDDIDSLLVFVRKISPIAINDLTMTST